MPNPDAPKNCSAVACTEEQCCVPGTTVQTTTTTPTPKCHDLSDKPIKICSCEKDPYCNDAFNGDTDFWHHGLGVFKAAETKTGDVIQYFQCPWLTTRPD